MAYVRMCSLPSPDSFLALQVSSHRASHLALIKFLWPELTNIIG